MKKVMAYAFAVVAMLIFDSNGAKAQAINQQSGGCGFVLPIPDSPIPLEFLANDFLS